MLKTILNFKGVEVLGREEQKNIIGGGPEIVICTTPCAMIISPENPCFVEGCASTPFPDSFPEPDTIKIG
jgi:hypothetical protein